MKPLKKLIDLLILIVAINSSTVECFGKQNNSIDIFTCCSLVYGSCRTSCGNLSLVQPGAIDSSSKDSKLNEIKRFCSSIQVEFWGCINKTLQAISRGSQWSGRKCCSLGLSPRCQNTCVTSSSKSEVNSGCRQSDEQYLYSCFERQEIADECCGNARTSECLQACHDAFDQRSTIIKEKKRDIEEICYGNTSNTKVVQCVRNFIDTTPINNAKQYLPCCKYSDNQRCKDTCKRALETIETTQETIDELEMGGCGPPLPHDPLWQCFLSAGKKVLIPSTSNEVSQINHVGMDSAKLHCCHKAIAPKCRRLCVQTFSNDWTITRGDFDVDCLLQNNEINLRRCIDEVDEPCELGCDGLSFCSNFNNRPTELFRSCNIHADVAAHSDISMWQHIGSLSLPGFNLPIKNISKCSMDTWRAIACVLQVKPCTKGSHWNQICREDCYEILNKCMDWTRLQNDYTAASLCSKFSPNNDMPCVSIKPYLEPSDIPTDTLGHHHKITLPCKGHPCNETEVCILKRYGMSGFQCVPGCSLGEASNYWVPFGSYIRIPVSPAERGCLKICRCGYYGKIEHCQPLPCFSYDACNLAGRGIEHGTWFYVECNICSCFAGEITCTKKQCPVPGITDRSHTSLPCNCPAHYVPVCGKNGNNYYSACIAKCTGLQDSDIEFGECTSHNPCQKLNFICPINTKCIENRQVCLSVMHRPCQQYKCVNMTTECNLSEIACDTEGRSHSTVCNLLNSGAEFSYFGPCFEMCSRKGTVCGINGISYRNECEAWSDYSLVDYKGNCREVGLLGKLSGKQCKSVKCKKLPSNNCQKIIPPGACCSICSGAFRTIFSRKQIDRALYALKGKVTDTVNLKSILKALDNLIQVSECQLFGYLTMETDLFIVIQSKNLSPSDIQIEVCSKEAEKLATLIATQSHHITSNLALSALTVANMVAPFTDSNKCAHHFKINYILYLISILILLKAF